MEFREVLQGRRMVRHYREETVAEDVLERAVRMVHRALGAGFAQGHRIIVVTNAGK